MIFVSLLAAPDVFITAKTSGIALPLHDNQGEMLDGTYM